MIAITVISVLLIETSLLGDLGTFTNQTSTYLISDPSVGADDVAEKDYAWGDVDQDGDIDLICVRKQPFSTIGRRTNVLFMNESGILVDRTLEYATNSDVEGDMGFLTPTNDRDVKLYDLDNDGWLDIVIATTLTDNDFKHLSHPRIYMNLGEVDGIWQGFRFENDRIPQMHPSAGPRFCSVAVGDLTGDGYADLYFGDYDSGTILIFDYNNRLLINDGNGFFTDESTSRMSTVMLWAAFGAASEIADMNGDGVNDVIKQTALSQPYHVAIIYNDVNNEGFFNGYDTINNQSPYFTTIGDLNGDGLMDLLIIDDGADKYYLNAGNGGDGHANFDIFTLENSDGFGGNALIVDINKDGHQDIIVTDVDVDIPGCIRNTHIYQNMGDTPNVTFEEVQFGFGNTQMQGVHDVAVFDINGDTWPDIIFGRCNSTEVWIQTTPPGILFTYPNGLPDIVEPEHEFVFQTHTELIAFEDIDYSSGLLTVRTNGTDEETYPMPHIGDDLFQVTLPATPCANALEFKIAVDLVNGVTFSDPSNGWYSVMVGVGTEISFRDEIEGDVSNWIITNSKTLTTGAWEQADPNGTIFNTLQAAPNNDATEGIENVLCFVTQNGTYLGNPSEHDVDNGATTLISPLLDVGGSDGTISYHRWFFDSTNMDELETKISNDDGANWVTVHATSSTSSQWEFVSFLISDHVTPTDLIRVSFTAADYDIASIVEAGIDNFQLEIIVCELDCIGDINNDGMVDVTDLLSIITFWGTTNVDHDLDGDGVVAVGDLLIAISNWGSCL